MEKATVNGVELEYEVTGSGEPVLLISNGPIRDTFLPFLSEDALVERYRLITYRQRRMVEGARDPVAFAEHASDAAELLGHLGIRRAHVLGHSTGAAIALQLAVSHPAAVHTLGLLEPPLLSVPAAGAFLEKVGPAIAAYRSGDRAGAVAAFLSAACSLEWEACRTAIEKHVPGGVAQAITDADLLFQSYLPALGAWEFGAEQAAGISQPVLSVVGTDTEQLFAESDELLNSWFPQLERCRIEGVAHLLHIQCPRPVARGIAGFLGRHPMSDETAAIAVPGNERWEGGSPLRSDPRSG